MGGRGEEGIKLCGAGADADSGRGADESARERYHNAYRKGTSEPFARELE